MSLVVYLYKISCTGHITICVLIHMRSILYSMLVQSTNVFEYFSVSGAVVDACYLLW